MNNKKIEEGTIIKGKDLEGRVLSEDMNMKEKRQVDNKINLAVWQSICGFLIFLVVFFIVCICGLQTRANDLQMQLDQCTEIEELNLHPCPVCGNDVKLNPVNDSFYIKCDNFLWGDGCGLQTGYYKSKNKLIKQWNNMK